MAENSPPKISPEKPLTEPPKNDKYEENEERKNLKHTSKFILIVTSIVVIYLIPVLLGLNDLRLGMPFKWIIDPVWTIVYIIIGIGIAYFIRVSYYTVEKLYNLELSSMIFVIILILSILIFLTIVFEYVPERYNEFHKQFPEMSVSIDYKSPLTIPIKTINANERITDKIDVTIYNNNTNSRIESVKLISPINSIISSSQTEFSNVTNSTGKKKYSLDISAAHTGEIFNKTDEYKIDISYSNLRHMTNILRDNYSDFNTELLINNVTASNEQNISLIASNLIDRNIQTRWASQVPANLTLDLGSQKTISSINILWYQGIGRQYDFDVAISNNSKGFTKIFTGRSDGISNSGMYNFSNTLGRYVRVNSDGGLNGNQSLQYVSINDTRVFGSSSSTEPNSGKGIDGASSHEGSDVNDTDILQNQMYLQHIEVPFPWNVRTLDLGLTTYFWIVMGGVITSRLFDFLLRRLVTEDKINVKVHSDIDQLADKAPHGNIDNWKKNVKPHYEDLRGLSRCEVQNLHLKDLLWIVFSFIIAISVFSSFKQSVTLSDSILINISLAFGFGFTFDRTLELATRFKELSSSDMTNLPPIQPVSVPATDQEQGEKQGSVSPTDQEQGEKQGSVSPTDQEQGEKQGSVSPTDEEQGEKQGSSTSN